MAVLLRKMIGIGRLPDDMREQVEAEGEIHLAEFVPVTFRCSGKVPGKTAKGNIRSYVGDGAEKGGPVRRPSVERRTGFHGESNSR